MSTIEDVISQVIQGKIKEGYIPCLDKTNQESVRVMTFNAKNKLPQQFRDKIAISKYTHKDAYYVKVYEKPTTGFMVMNEQGILIPGKKEWSLDDDKALRRQVKLMRKDGKSEDEIAEVVDNAMKLGAGKITVEEEKVEDLEKLEDDSRGVDSKPDVVLTEKEEMRKMLKGEKNGKKNGFNN